MQAGTGTVQDTAFKPEQHQKGSADHRLAHSAQGRIEKQQDSIQQQADALAKPQEMKKQVQDSDQYAYMKTADGQDVGDAKP